MDDDDDEDEEDEDEKDEKDEEDEEEGGEGVANVARAQANGDSYRGSKKKVDVHASPSWLAPP